MKTLISMEGKKKKGVEQIRVESLKTEQEETQSGCKKN
jgi:hypothetical protein